MSDIFERAVREALIASWEYGYTAHSLGQFDVTFPVAHDEAARVSSKLRAALLAEMAEIAEVNHVLGVLGIVSPYDKPATAKEPT